MLGVQVARFADFDFISEVLSCLDLACVRHFYICFLGWGIGGGGGGRESM